MAPLPSLAPLPLPDNLVHKFNNINIGDVNTTQYSYTSVLDPRTGLDKIPRTSSSVAQVQFMGFFGTEEDDTGGSPLYKGTTTEKPKVSNSFFPQDSINQTPPETPFAYPTYTSSSVPQFMGFSGTEEDDMGGSPLYQGETTDTPKASKSFFPQHSITHTPSETPFSYPTYPSRNPVSAEQAGYKGAAMEKPKLFNAGNPFCQESNNPYLPETPFSYVTNPIVENSGSLNTAIACSPKLVSAGNSTYNQYLPKASFGDLTNPIYNYQVSSTFPSYVKQTPVSNRLVEMEFFLNKLRTLRGWSEQKLLKLVENDPKLLDNLDGEDIVLMATDHLGLDYLKTMLTNVNNTTKILLKSQLHLFVLIKENLGSSLFNKLVESCNELQLRFVVNELAMYPDYAVQAACTQHGTRSLQKLMSAVKKVNVQLADTLFNNLNLQYVMMDRYGIQLISHCLNLLPSKQNKMIYETAIEHCVEIAMHEKGCLVMNGIIDNIKNSHREELLTKISENAVCLSQDPYGNYVVQKILQLANPLYITMICNQLRGNYVQLSMQKCGSHIVEKCIVSISLRAVALDLLSQSNETLMHLARDQYGNYVIQKLLKTTKEKCRELYEKLVMVLSRNKDMLRNHPNGRNVFSLLDSEKAVLYEN